MLCSAPCDPVQCDIIHETDAKTFKGRIRMSEEWDRPDFYSFDVCTGKKIELNQVNNYFLSFLIWLSDFGDPRRDSNTVAIFTVLLSNTLPHRKAVGILNMQCPGNRLILWEPSGRDLCDNMTCEPPLYGYDKDSSDTRVLPNRQGKWR